MRKEKGFDHPRLFGFLYIDDRELTIAHRVDRHLRSIDPKIRCLPLKINKRKIKNVYKAMRLLDIEGGIIAGGCQRLGTFRIY
ncbi:MAG: hypothetical protein ABIE74_00775 [Pseudomonadota bacterium]